MKHNSAIVLLNEILHKCALIIEFFKVKSHLANKLNYNNFVMFENLHGNALIMAISMLTFLIGTHVKRRHYGSW